MTAALVHVPRKSAGWLISLCGRLDPFRNVIAIGRPGWTTVSAGTKAVASPAAVVIVTLFGLVSSWWAILIPPFVLLGGLCFSVVGYTFTSLIPKIDLYSYFFTLFITPMFLFSGTFFPIEQLPEGLQVVAQFNPLHQLVVLVRHACFGFEATDLLRLAGLFVFAVVLWREAVRRMSKRLID